MNISFPDFCWSACESAMKSAKAVWEEQAKSYGTTGFLLGFGVCLIACLIYIKLRERKQHGTKN